MVFQGREPTSVWRKPKFRGLGLFLALLYVVGGGILPDVVYAASPPEWNRDLAGVGTLDLESAFYPPGSNRSGASVSITLTVAYPDSLASTDTRAILLSMVPGKAKPILPRGKLDAAEENFLVGLRALVDGNGVGAAENWGKIRGRISPVLGGTLRVNFGVLHLLRGEPLLAESLWVAEWRTGRAAEAAWRNLLSLQMALGRYRHAEALADAMLAQQPGHRLALQAKAALLRQFGSETVWEEFVRTRALASPDMQLIYGELLLRRGRYAEAVKYLDRALAELPASGWGWRLLAEAQYKQGFYYYALDCLENAGRAGYHPAEFYELYARVLWDCCTGDFDPRAVRARASVESLLEKGLPKDLARRSMAQLLYHMYCQNQKPDAAKALQSAFWFHFEGPRQDIPALGDPHWKNTGVDARALNIPFGLRTFPWVMALRRTDVFNAEL